MSKPVREVRIETPDGKTGVVHALFDTGAHPTILRADRVPDGATVVPFLRPRTLRTAAESGVLTVTAATVMTITVGDRMIEGEVLISPQLGRDMIVGAGMMQQWDITVANENGRTEIRIGRDLRDPDVQEIA